MDIHWEYIHARIYNANTQVVNGPQVSIRVRCTRVYRYYGTDRSATIKKSATSIVFVRNGCVYEHIYRVYTLLDLLPSPYRVFERSIEGITRRALEDTHGPTCWPLAYWLLAARKNSLVYIFSRYLHLFCENR